MARTPTARRSVTPDGNGGAFRRFWSAWPAALAGGAAAATGMAVAELFAGLIRGGPSLVTEIGALLISLQPSGAKDIFVSLFGTNDKLALMILVVAGALLVATGAGVLARRSFWLGGSIFAAFALLGGYAGLRDPLVDPLLSVASAVIGLATGLVVLAMLLELARRRPDTVMRSSMPDWARRRFLLSSAGVLVAASVVGRYGRALVDGQHPSGAVTSSKLPKVQEAVTALTAEQSIAAAGITPLVVPSTDFYRIDTALLVPRVDETTWKLEVKGMVDHPETFTYDELLAMPLFEQYVTIACVSNEVGGHLVGNALWTGVRLKDVLTMAGVQRGATQIVGRAVDGFTVGFPTEWALAPDREPMIALGMNRDVLPAEHGFPARLIVPGLYGYVSATKWLSSIELTTREAVDGYWVPLGWAKDAPILTQSRIDAPRGGQSVVAGPVTVAGVAWAPDRGIEGVDVRIDNGDWQPATISKPISAGTWVQWVLPWSAVSGRHLIEVRATDGRGALQTEDVTSPAPDGARGHHRITVNVS